MHRANLYSAAVTAAIAFVLPMSILADDSTESAKNETELKSEEKPEDDVVLVQAEVPPAGNTTQVAADGSEETTLPETTIRAPVAGESIASEPFPNSSNLPDDVTLTATRNESLLRNFGGTVSIITGDTIRASDQPFAAEVLRSTPGLDVFQNGGAGHQATILIRGASGRSTKVLLDGIQVNDPTAIGRTFDFGLLNSIDIERIEVLRGPQSSLYGSDAAGGVINVTTLRGDGPTQVRASSQFGTFWTRQSNAIVSGGTDAYYYSFGASNYETDGFSTASPRFGNREPDWARNNTYTTRMGVNLTENINIDFVTRYIQNGIAIDDYDFINGFAIDNYYATNPSTALMSRLQFLGNFLDGQVQQRLGVNYVNYNRNYSDPNNFLGQTLYASIFKGDSKQIDYQGSLQLLEHNTLTYGYDYKQDDYNANQLTVGDPFGFDGFIVTPPDGLWNHGVYLQDQFVLFEELHSVASVRWDDYEQAGDATTYRIASVYNAPTNTAIHGSYGTAFVAPTVFELYDPTFGNSNLKPEKTKGWEYGVRQSLFEQKVVVDCTYFRNDFTDLISFINVVPFNSVNIGRARSSGIELTGTFQPTQTTWISANFTHNDTHDVTNDQDLPRVPRDKATLTVKQSVFDKRANVYVQALWIGHRYDFSSAVLPPGLAPFAVINVAGSFDVTQNVRLIGRIDNLTDTEYEQVLTFTAQPFAAYGGVEVKFGGQPVAQN